MSNSKSHCSSSASSSIPVKSASRLPPSSKSSSEGTTQEPNESKTSPKKHLTTKLSIPLDSDLISGEKALPTNRPEVMSSDSTATRYKSSHLRKRRSSRRLSSPLITTQGGRIRVLDKERGRLVGSESSSRVGIPKIYNKPFVDVTNQTEQSPRPIYSHSSPFGRRKSLIHMHDVGLSIPSNIDEAVVPTVSSFSSTSSKEEDNSNMDTSNMDMEEDEENFSPPNGTICLAENYDDDEELSPCHEGKGKEHDVLEDSPSLQEILEDTPTRTLQGVLEDSSPEQTLKEILEDSPTPQDGDLAFLQESSMDDETIDLKQVMELESDENPLSGTKRSRNERIHMESKFEDVNSGRRKRSRQSFVLPNISLEKDERIMTLLSPCRKNEDKLSRRKMSRQSIIVPNIVVHEDNGHVENADERNVPLSSLRQDISKEKGVNDNNEMGKELTMEERMERVRDAVRSLCSVPLDERYKSKDAALIEDLTGYPILSTIDRTRRNFERKKMRKMKPDEFSKAKHNSKRNIINGMGALVKKMEKRKKEQDYDLEQGTGCRVEKKKGRYKYFNIESGERISSKKYQGLYLSRMREKQMEKECPKKAREYKLSKSRNYGNGEGGKQTNNDGPSERRHSVNVPKLEEGEMTVGQLPIPFRDEISSDPEIAEAQEKLFTLFDKALEEYSLEIMRINVKRQEAKKLGQVKSLK